MENSEAWKFFCKTGLPQAYLNFKAEERAKTDI